MPKTCPTPRRTPCDGAWPHEKEDCCYKRLPKESGTGTSRKASTSSKSKKPTMNDASKAARKIAQDAMKKATQGPTVADLRAVAKAKKIKGFSTMTKAQLMQALGKSGSAAPSTKVASTASAKGTTSVSDSVSPAWLTFVQKSWNNIANEARGMFPSDTKTVMSESTLRFVAKKMLRNVKKIGDGVKRIEGSSSLETRLLKFERDGMKRAKDDPNLKKRIASREDEGAFVDMLQVAMERAWRYEEIEPEELKRKYFVTETLKQYVVSEVSGLETVPSSKLDPILFYLVAIAQVMVEALGNAAIRKEENGKIVEVKVTEDSIKTKAKEDVLLFLFYT